MLKLAGPPAAANEKLLIEIVLRSEESVLPLNEYMPQEHSNWLISKNTIGNMLLFFNVVLFNFSV